MRLSADRAGASLAAGGVGGLTVAAGSAWLAVAAARARPDSAPADGAGAPLKAATVAATAAHNATSPPPTTTGRARRLMVSSLTVSQLYKAPPAHPAPRPSTRPQHFV